MSVGNRWVASQGMRGRGACPPLLPFTVAPVWGTCAGLPRGSPGARDACSSALLEGGVRGRPPQALTAACSLSDGCVPTFPVIAFVEVGRMIARAGPLHKTLSRFNSLKYTNRISVRLRYVGPLMAARGRRLEPWPVCRCDARWRRRRGRGTAEAHRW